MKYKEIQIKTSTYKKYLLLVGENRNSLCWLYAINKLQDLGYYNCYVEITDSNMEINLHIREDRLETIPNLVMQLKGFISYMMRQDFPELKQYPRFWSKVYQVREF